MKESVLRTDKNLIFRETFQSEDVVRKNGWVASFVGTLPTNFNNGTVTFNNASNSMHLYMNLKGVYSVRIRYASAFIGEFSLPIVDFRDNGANSNTRTGLIYANTPIVLAPSSGTNYVNGVASTVLSSDTREIIVSGITLDAIMIVLGKFSGSPSYWDGNTWELFEIYKGTLTANEVKNLYENRQNREINNHTEQIETSATANFVVSASLPPDTFVASGNNVTSAINDGSSTGGFYSNVLATSGSIGDFYRIRFTAVRTSGSLTFTVAALPNTIASTIFDNTTISASGDYDFYIRRSSVSDGYPIFYNAGAYEYSITNFRIDKVNVNPTKEILRVDARNGVIANKYSLNNIGTNLSTNGTFSAWTGAFPNETPTGWSISGSLDANNYVTRVGNACRIVSNGSLIGIGQAILTVGKYYKITFDCSAISGVGEMNIGTGTILPLTSSTVAIGSNTFYGVCAGSTSLIIKRSTAFNATITNIIAQELVPSLTNTAVTAVKSGGIYVMNFKGATSRIDCGAYNPLIGDKTFIVWVTPMPTAMGSEFKRIFDNNKFAFGVRSGVNNKLYASNDLATTVYSPTGSVIPGNTYCFIVTRTFAGIINFYINGVLSGTANQSGGTPVAGNTNLCIGDTSANTNPFNGKISGVKILNGILSVDEISQLFSAERKFYNV